MIQTTQRGLILIFTLTILAFTLALILAAGTYGFISLDRAIRRHLLHEVNTELVPYYLRNDLISLRDLSESDYFQILNKSGKVVIATANAQGFDLPVPRDLLSAAFAGRTVFQTAQLRGSPFLVVYFPLDEFYVGRAATSTDFMNHQLQVVFWLALLGLPLLAVLSFLVSRSLVRRAMRPIGELFTFHTTFSSNVSHELRTPLTSLLGNMEVALRREQPPEEYRAVLEVGLRETERLISTLDNLSLLAALQSKGVTPMRRQTDLAELLAGLLEGEEGRHPDLSWTLKLPAPVPCRCDASLMRHVLRNLVENAIRYTPPGGAIEAAARVEGGQAIVALSNPCDPPRADPESLLEPFARGENEAYRLPHGRGLGLYLARTIVRVHGGELSIEVGPGARFTVTISLPGGGNG